MGAWGKAACDDGEKSLCVLGVVGLGEEERGTRATGRDASARPRTHPCLHTRHKHTLSHTLHSLSLSSAQLSAAQLSSAQRSMRLAVSPLRLSPRNNPCCRFLCAPTPPDSLAAPLLGVGGALALARPTSGPRP